MAIKLTFKKKRVKTENPEEFNTIFKFSIFFLAISVIAYGVIFYINRVTEKKIEDVRAETRKMESEAVNFKEKEKELENYKNIVINYSQIFNQRQVVSHFISVIESSVHPQAIFKEISVNVDGKTAQINGNVYDLKTLEQQYHLFRMIKFEKGNEEKSNIISPITEVVLDTMGEIEEEDEGNFRFSFVINISLNPEIFKP